MWLHNPSVYYQDYYHYKFALTFAYLYIQNSRTFVVNKFDFDTKMKRVSEKMHANYLIKLNKNKQIEKNMQELLQPKRMSFLYNFLVFYIICIKFSKSHILQTFQFGVPMKRVVAE